LPDSGFANGIVTYVSIMRDAFRAQGHDVSVLGRYEYQDFEGRKHQVAQPGRLQTQLAKARARLDPAWRHTVFSAMAFVTTLKAAHARRPLDVVEIEESFGWSHELMGSGPRIVARLHGPHVFGRDDVETEQQKVGSAWRIRCEGRALAKVDALSCPSGRLLRATLDHYKLQPQIAETIPNPMPLGHASARWSLDGCDPDQLLCVGRFDSRKGADIVLDGFALAAAARPSLRLIMVGPDYGLSEPDGSRTHFADYARAMLSPETREKISFLGTCSSEEISKLRLRSAFTIIGSRFENFPYSLAESMAIGMASIVSDSFGNGEMVINGETGLVVPIGDREALASAILRLRDDPQMLARMGERAYLRCAEWLDPDRIARETVALYRRAGA
jgi:glycosyltransferase involved in cell wall biosynthesis